MKKLLQTIVLSVLCSTLPGSAQCSDTVSTSVLGIQAGTLVQSGWGVNFNAGAKYFAQFPIDSSSAASAVCIITGSNFCTGGATQLCAATSSAYVWSTGATTQCITVTTGGTYTVTVTDGAGVTGSCTKTIVAYLPPACTMPVSVVVCPGMGATLCAPGGFAGYLWGTGATTQCIFVYSSGFYSVTVTDFNGCTNSCSTALIHGDPFCNITGSNFCYGSSTQLCSNVAYSYLWSTGATTQCITVATGGTYTVTTASSNGCTCMISKTVTAYPPPNCTVFGNSSYCPGYSTQICGTTGSADYLWSTGATTQCVTVPAGNYTVTVTDANGCNSSCSKTVTVSTLPAATITPAGPTSFCTGGNVVLNANAGAGLYYQWKKGGNNISGATAPSYTAKASGTYKVVVTNLSGCSKTSGAVTVTGPPSATVTVTGSLIICPPDSSVLSVPYSAGSLYQWKKNNVTITNATASQYTVKLAGNYKVTVTGANGCTKTSAQKTITVTCREGGDIATDASSNAIIIYPNPAKDQLHFDCAIIKGTATLIIKNILGQEIYRKTAEATDAGLSDDINIKELNEGIYVLSVYAGGEIYSAKFIKE